MTFLVINSIANYERNAHLAEKFEQLLEGHKRRVAAVTSNFIPSGDLKRVYVQFQFDGAGMLNATRGIKVGRYSLKHQHLEGTVEVSLAVFEKTDDVSRSAALTNLLIDVLRQMNQKLDGKVSNNLSELLSLIEEDRLQKRLM